MGKLYWHSLLSSSDMFQWSTPRKQIQTWNLSMQWVGRTKAKCGWRLPGEEGSPKVKPQKQAQTRQVLMMVFVWSLLSAMPAVKYFCVWMVTVIVTVFRQNPTYYVMQVGLELSVFDPTSWVPRLKAYVLNAEGKGLCRHHAGPETKPSLGLFICISQWVLFLSLRLASLISHFGLRVISQ